LLVSERQPAAGLLLIACFAFPSCAALESWDRFGQVDSAPRKDAGGSETTGRDSAVDDVPPATTPISDVQQNFAAEDGTAATTMIRIPFQLPQRKGDLNVVAVGWYDEDIGVASVVDSDGNTYTNAVKPAILAAGSSSITAQGIWFAANIAGGAANQVTVTFSAPPDSPDIRIVEFSGLSPTSPLAPDGTASTTGNVAAAATGPVTTTIPRALLFGAGKVNNGDYPAAAIGFEGFITTETNLAQWRVVDETGTFTSTANAIHDGSSDPLQWVMQLEVFH
jgi:hypothetical protein